VLAALQGDLVLVLADLALQTKDDLLGGLGLLVEDGLGLTTITGLLSIVTTLTCGARAHTEVRSVFCFRQRKLSRVSRFQEKKHSQAEDCPIFRCKVDRCPCLVFPGVHSAKERKEE